MKERELPERILREKPQRKTRLIHPQSSLRDSSNSSTLFLSIVKSLRGLLPKFFLTIFISVKGLFGVLGSSQKGTNFTLVDAIVKQRNLGSQKRNRFGATSLEQEAWRATERFFTEFFGFLFDNTSWCYLCLHLSSLLLFISFLLLCCFKYGLEQLSCLYACVYTIPHLVLSQYKINQAVTLIWGSKQLVCF